MSTWIEQHLAFLSAEPVCGYQQGGQFTEPTALAALALMAHERIEPARAALDWLADHQASDGSLGVSAQQPSPCWPTGVALLAWSHAATGHHPRYRPHALRAAAWIVRTKGETLPRQTAADYDSMLVGWPWVQGTHSWLEPTAWQVIGLKAAGLAAHPRCREAVRLLIDRLLPAGGCNYGNTVVLGQLLLPHLLPTGLVLTALAGETLSDSRPGKSCKYLLRELSARTATASLCIGLLGLAAHGAEPVESAHWLEAAATRSLKRPSGWHSALLLLAAPGGNSPLCRPPAADKEHES